METENIWFDGVSKKLIETHSKKNNLVEGNDRSLKTKTELVALSTLKDKKKQTQKSTNGIDSTKQSKLINGGSAVSTIRPNTGITEELAMDCEMVECYHHKSVLARVSIVNLFGHPIIDRYVAPPAKVTDYRTRYSGIRRKDLDNAPDFDTVQAEVARIIKNKIIVGHALHNDFSVLKLSHPKDKIRDTSVYFKYLFQGKTPSLKKLCESVLGVKIQKGEHDSVQDAQATMKLYVKERERWNSRVIKTASNPRHKKRQKKSTEKIKTFYVMT